MPAVINGPPTHALIVHAVVVLLPVSVLAALVLVFVPSSRRAFGLVSVAVAFVACLAVPLAFLSGSELRQRVSPSPLISRHVALAHQLLPIAAIFGVVLAAFVLVDLVRRAEAGDLNQIEAVLVARAPAIIGHWSSGVVVVVSRAVSVVLVVISIATAVAVVRVGDSGAKAVWHGRLSTSQTGH